MSSITSLDIPETATIDVSACNDDFVWKVLETQQNKKITANNKIYYTATDKVAPTNYESNQFGTTLVSNTYENGKGVMEFENNVTYIGQNAPVFYTSNLTSIIIPDSVTSIGSYALTSCEGLTSINIPDSVTSIGRGAFSGCKSLSTPVIHKNVFYYVG